MSLVRVQLPEPIFRRFLRFLFTFAAATCSGIKGLKMPLFNTKLHICTQKNTFLARICVIKTHQIYLQSVCHYTKNYIDSTSYKSSQVAQKNLCNFIIVLNRTKTALHRIICRFIQFSQSVCHFNKNDRILMFLFSFLSHNLLQKS